MKGKNVVIKWRNRWSGEEGFVESVSKKAGHMTATFDIKKAHKYSTKGALTSALNTLAACGEAQNNEFQCVEV